MKKKYEKINGHDVEFVKYEGKWLADAYDVAMAYDLGIPDVNMYLDNEHIEGYYNITITDGDKEIESVVELIGTDGINDLKHGRHINNRLGVKSIKEVSKRAIEYILNVKGGNDQNDKLHK